MNIYYHIVHSMSSICLPVRQSRRNSAVRYMCSSHRSCRDDQMRGVGRARRRGCMSGRIFSAGGVLGRFAQNANRPHRSIRQGRSLLLPHMAGELWPPVRLPVEGRALMAAGRVVRMCAGCGRRAFLPPFSCPVADRDCRASIRLSGALPRLPLPTELYQKIAALDEPKRGDGSKGWRGGPAEALTSVYHVLLHHFKFLRLPRCDPRCQHIHFQLVLADDVVPTRWQAIRDDSNGRRHAHETTDAQPRYLDRRHVV